MKSIEERAKETLQKRIRGSFGYRAAESVINGFNPAENITVYKAHGGERDDLERSLDLAIERTKPVVTANEIAKELRVDAGEAEAMLEEQTALYNDFIEHRDKHLKTLFSAYEVAKSEYDALSQFSCDNFQRIIDNLVGSAQAQYVRTRNKEWVTAVREACTPVRENVVAMSTASQEPDDKVAA